MPAMPRRRRHDRNSSALGDEIWNLNDLRGAEMTNKLVARIAMIGMMFGTFTLGYVCGSVSTKNLDTLKKIQSALTGK